jgi:hypothetical protein
VTNPDFPATGYVPSSKKNFAPRVGLAWSFNDNRTVLRAGYGVFHARLQTGLLNTLFLENGVYQKVISLATNNSNDVALAPVFPNRLAGIDRNPPAGTVNVTMAAKDFRLPYTQQGDVAIEHELTRDLGLTVNYIWSRGLHLTTVTDTNAGPFGDPVTYRINDSSGAQVGSYTTPTYRRGLRPNTNWAGINVVDAGGNSYYKDTLRRADALLQRQIAFVDVGTSGGIWGRSEGYCMMVGGDAPDVQRLKPILDTLAPPEGWGRGRRTC